MLCNFCPGKTINIKTTSIQYMRTFIAIEMPKKVCGILSAFQDEFRASIKASFPKSFHLTLKFLGEVDDKELESMKNTLQRIRSGSMLLELDSLGTFPDTSSPQVLWAGLKGDIDALQKLQKAVDAATEDIICLDHKGFVPHLTLARVKKMTDPTRFKEKLSLPLPAFKFDVWEFVLFKSTLTKEGPVYDELLKIPLRAK